MDRAPARGLSPSARSRRKGRRDAAGANRGQVDRGLRRRVRAVRRHGGPRGRDPVRDPVAPGHRRARGAGAPVARRPALSRRGAHAAAARGRSRPIDGRLRRAPGQQAGGERARPVGHGRRLHRRGPAARARAAADPGRGRARPHDLERASRGPRAARPHRRPRGQGEGGDSPAARGETDARHVTIGHGPRASRSRARRSAAAGAIRRGRAPSRTGPEGSASAFPRAAASPGAW